MASPISIIVEDLDGVLDPNVGGGTLDLSDIQLSNERPKKKLVYLVKNATHMPVESVLSAVLGNSESQSLQNENLPTPSEENSELQSLQTNNLQTPLKTHSKRKRAMRKESPGDKISQKVVIKGSDGKENMIFLDVPVPLEVVSTEYQEEDVDDPTWAPTKADHISAKNSTWSKLRRARSAVRNSMKILRLPKPQRKRESTKQQLFDKQIRKQREISKDDPNYTIMMENFDKPVSISTLKRHGLYQPKPFGYKINAPYKKDVAPYIEKISDTEYKCKICLTAKFRWNYKAEIHILEHLDWRPFECDVCGRSFTQNQYLTKHKRLHYPEDTNFMCEVCGKGFQRRYYLTYHMDEHLERTYTCQECGRIFSRRQKHDEHVRYHHKCHYSVCDICGQTLRTTALSRHRKQHGERSQGRKKRESTGLPPALWLACNICGRAFRTIRERDEHEAEHNNPLLPFHCDGVECVAHFKTKRSLNNHILRIHSQPAEDECEVANQEEECDEATRVLDELSSTIVVSIPDVI